MQTRKANQKEIQNPEQQPGLFQKEALQEV